MPTALIADDEDLQRTALQRMLEIAWPELEIVASCEDGVDAREALARLQPDVAFLDIRMPELSGLGVAAASAGSCQVVFTTAYDTHALEAFRLGAADYLLKPVTQERLEETVARLRRQLANHAQHAEAGSDAGEPSRMQEPAARIRWISTTAGNTIKLFPIEEILFFEADSRYTRVVSLTDEGLLRKPIKELQAGLDPDQFWQIHRGTLVAVRAIARAHRDVLGNISIELRGHPQRLKVSQSYAWRFRGEVIFR